MSTKQKTRKRKRKRSSKGFNRTLFPSTVASSLTAAAGLPNNDRIASNAMSNELFVQPNAGLSTGLKIRYAENEAAPAQRSNSARTASSSLSELAAIHDSNPTSYQEYLDNKKNTKGTNTYAKMDEQGDVIMGGRKTKRKKRRRKAKKKRKTKRKKRRRKRKTKKRRR